MAQLIAQPIDYFNILDGIDTISSSIKLGAQKFRDAQNINLFPVGGYQWRNGYIKLNSSPVNTNACTGLYMARFSSQTNTAILIAGSKVYTMAGLNGTWTDVTNGVTVTAGNNNLWNFAILNDIVCMSNDVDTSLQMTSAGTITTLAGSPPFTSALFNLEYRGYMFWGQTVEGGTRQYDRLRFSNINDPGTIGANNYIDVAKKSGGDVRGAVNYKTYLYVFKRQGIYQINYQPTRVNSSGVLFPFTEFPNPVIPGVGLQSHQTIVKFTTPITHRTAASVELVFFVDQFGIPRIFDGINSVQIGYPISRSRDTGITSLKDMDKTRLPQMWAVNYPERNQIMVFMTKTGSQHDTCWVLDYTAGFAWSRHNFFNTFNCGALFEKTDGTFRVFMGDYSGTVYEYDTGTTDNGATIQSYAIHGDAFLGSPTIRSKWSWIEIRGQTGSTSQKVTIDAFVDGSDTTNRTVALALAKTTTTWGTTGAGGTMTWGSSSWGKQGLVTSNQEIGLDAKTLRIKLSNNTRNNTFSTEGFSLYGIPEGSSQQ